MKIDWRWLITQFLLPVVGPILVGLAVVAAWSTRPGDDFAIRWDVVLDVTPKALTFYNLTLICVTLNAFRPKLAEHPVLGVFTGLTALPVVVYHAFTVIWRHDENYQPDANVYMVTLVLTGVTVALCHWCHRRSGDG